MSTVQVPSRLLAPTQYDDLACPRCGGTLAADATGLSCPACRKTYPIHDGIVDLRCHRQDYYFNPLRREEMAALTTAAVTQPWEDTIQRFLKGVQYNAEWLDDLVVDGRYAWKLLLRLPSNARVLDLGCGLGNLVKNMVPCAASVDALDLTLERLKFAQVRFRRFGVADRVRLLAGGDGAHLPFPDGSFDCVTLSGVLEWVAVDDGVWARGSTRMARATGALLSFFGEKNPRATQRRFLAEIRRVLKPDGQLFIAIENRLSYTYFGGRPDHHSNLWFGSLLPRFLANLYSMMARRAPYRTYTYSAHGLGRLLRRAGFPEVEFYGLTPGYTQLAELIPFGSKRGPWVPPPSHGRERIRRNKYFVPAYGAIAATTPVTRPSLAEQLASALAEKLSVDVRDLKFATMKVTGSNKGIINADTPDRRIILKIPFGADAAAAASGNYRYLELAAGRGELSGLVPRPLAAGEVGGVRYFAEERLCGTFLNQVIDRGNTAVWLAAASRVLGALNPALGDEARAGLSGGPFEREVLAPLQRVRRAAGAQLAERIETFFRARFEGVESRTGTVHGDFAASNILVDATSVTGVVGWDYVSDAGLPAVDAIRLVDSLPRTASADGCGSVVGLFDLAALTEAEQRFLLANYGRCGFEARHHGALVVLYWLQRVGSELRGDLRYDRPAIERRITSVFGKLLELGEVTGAA